MITLYRDGEIEIEVETEDTKEGFRWRIRVNDSWSLWTSFYQGLLYHQGYMVATAYWSPLLQEFVPFSIQYAEKA